MSTATSLEGIVGAHVAAVNAFDTDAIVATFADDALVNDARREFWGKDAIRRWVATDMVADRVTIDVIEVINHHAQTIVRGRYDGEYDKTGLPDELILTNYFIVLAGKIASLIVIRSAPAYEDIVPADLPAVIRNYFALDADRAIDSIMALFTDDATVIDEGETRHGTAQIRAWQDGPASKYTYATEVLGADALAANRYIIAGRLTGNFPGGTAELKWDFTLAGDQINQLIIAP